MTSRGEVRRGTVEYLKQDYKDLAKRPPRPNIEARLFWLCMAAMFAWGFIVGVTWKGP